MAHPTLTFSLSAGKRGPMHPGRTGGGPVDEIDENFMQTYLDFYS